jgi:ribosomal protein S18 acetylase RimI-like enzyme
MLHSPPADLVSLRRAEPAQDNAALCDLARRCPQGRRFRFYHERSDARERCRGHGDVEILVAQRGGRLAAAGTVARKQVWLAGGWRSAAYIFDLMVDPEQRRQGLARRMLAALRQFDSPPPQLVYSYILADNEPSRRLFEQEGFLAHPHSLLYHAVVPRLARRPPPPGFHLCEPVTQTAAATADARLRERYEFVDATAGHEGLFQLDWRGTRAWAAVRRCGPQVFVAVPWYWALMGWLLPFGPRRGHTVRAWSLHHLVAEGPEPSAALRHLVEAVAWVAARENVDALLLPLFDDDPTTALVRRLSLTGWGLAPPQTCLYVGGELAGAVLQASRPLLMSGKDG